MPLTRSHDNLANLVEPTNCSFTVNIEEPNTTQTQTLSRSARNTTNRNQNRDNSEVRLRQIVSESMMALRSEMTDLISSELRSFIQNLNTNNNSDSNIPTNSHSVNNELPNNTTSSSSLQEPFIGEKVSNII
ncbi:hypothetical protein CVS40_4881 [Lucilia cuprina]|nr:hypothetical protein CVS40_4881 [Lucilia cuprina]